MVFKKKMKKLIFENRIFQLVIKMRSVLCSLLLVSVSGLSLRAPMDFIHIPTQVNGQTLPVMNAPANLDSFQISHVIPEVIFEKVIVPPEITSFNMGQFALPNVVAQMQNDPDITAFSNLVGQYVTP